MQVTINPLPTATLTGGGSCVGNASTVSVAFPTGTAPYTFDYTVDGVPQTQVTTSTNPYVITTPVLTTPTTYALTSLSDANCTATSTAIAAATVTITPSSTTTFTGSVSSDWTNAGNWTNCVPTSIISAVIPTGKAAVLNSGTAVANNLDIQGSGTFILSGTNPTLTLKGNMTTATATSFAATAGTVTFDGTGAQTVAAGSYNILSLSGSTTKMLGGDISIGGTLDLSGGLLTQGNNQVRLTGTASNVNGAGPGHLLVQNGTGRLRIDNVGTGAGTRAAAFFPVGTSASADGFTPITISNSGTTDYFLGSVVDGITPATSHAVNKTWNISEGTVGGSNATLTLQWNAANELSSLNHNRVDIAHYVGGAWAGTCATCYDPAVGSDPYTVTRTGYTSFSPFGVQDDAKPLPVELTRFEAVRNGSDAALSWATASESNSKGFEVQASADGKAFRMLAFVESASAKMSGPRTYSYTDYAVGKTGLRYYRLRQVDTDGSASYSPVRTLAFGPTTETSFVASPNPFGEQLTLTMALPIAKTGTLTITDATGRTVRQQTLSLPAGTTLLTVDKLAALPSGFYLLNLDLAGQHQHLKVTK